MFVVYKDRNVRDAETENVEMCHLVQPQIIPPRFDGGQPQMAHVYPCNTSCTACEIVQKEDGEKADKFLFRKCMQGGAKPIKVKLHKEFRSSPKLNIVK